MNCETARDRLLEADLAALRRAVEASDSRSDDDLARHLARCPACAAMAELLVRELDALDQALDDYAAGGDPEAAADAVLARTRDPAMPDEGDSDRIAAGEPEEAVPRRTAWRRAWVPAALAAGVAALLLLGDEPRPGPGPEPGAEPGAEPGSTTPRVAVTPPADRAAAIMETGNPNITIVWIYEREDS